MLVHIRYFIGPEARIIVRLEPWRLMCCPHKNLYDCLRQPKPNHAGYNCRRCQTRFRVAIEHDQSEVQVTRNLEGGKEDPVSKVWQDQRDIILHKSLPYVAN